MKAVETGNTEAPIVVEELQGHESSVYETAPLDVHPADLNADGTLKAYAAPVFDMPDLLSYTSDLPVDCAAEAGDEPPEASTPESRNAVDPEPRAGWCPGGSWSGGICNPPNNSRDNWMARYCSNIGLPIEEMILPGSHNAGCDKKAPHTASNETCQDVPIYEQLHAGIRAFDLRVRFYSGYGAGDARRFQLVHSVSSGRTFKGDVLNAITRFRADNGGRGSQEVVVLDIHERKDFTDAAQREFMELIKGWGRTELVPYHLRGFVMPQLMALGKKTVVAMSDAVGPDFWPKVEQQWIGYSVTDSDELERFANRVVMEQKPLYKLRALQYHKHAKVSYVPDDISDRVMSRSAFSDPENKLRGIYILNTDWALRHRMVDNCIAGNGARQKELGSRLWRISHNEAPNPEVIPKKRSGIFCSYDGNHRPRLAVDPSHNLDHVSMVYINEATWSVDFSMVDITNNGGLSSLRMDTGDRLSLWRDNMRRGPYDIRTPRYLCPNAEIAQIPTPVRGDKITYFETANAAWAPRLRLPSSAHMGAVIIVMCNSTLATTVLGEQMNNSQAVALPSGGQCAVQFVGSGKWKLIGQRP
ncbi:hypothetical protein [Pseudomonas rhizosphaerae]|uniref:hypothetical protein n=1 Tax=Pseudomonas rhizosphaerae TaxID=216142 RepID=UPI002B4961A2|nr:hypothetical protein [Pseudomonas rhizosphaerae]MEB2870825.1 hypothetical protein [Pseudomonas rhizosphaerae]